MTTSRTARAVAAALEACGKSQREVAQQMGLPRPNALSMMKAGEMKMPIDRIPAFSRATNTSARELLEVALCEYHPEIWLVIDETLTPAPSGDHQRDPHSEILLEREQVPSRELQINIQGPAHVIDRFRELAKRERRTYADMLRVLIEDAEVDH